MLRSRLSISLLAIVLLMLTNGCNRGAGTGSISGKITFQETPIPGGTIAFLSQSGKVATGNIKDGNYSITELEVGPDAKITVTSHPPSPMMVPPTGPDAGTPVYDLKHFVRLPDKYKDVNRSGLTYDVVEGTQIKNFDLQP